MQQILYLIQKEFRQIFRDKPMLFITFFAPVVQMTILGFALTVDVKNIKTVIADYDRTPVSQEICRRFENNSYFAVKGYIEGQTNLREKIDDWQAQLAIIIPKGFSKDSERRMRPEIQIIVDGLDGNSAGIALGYAQGILADYAAELLTNNLSPTAYQRNAGSVEPQTRMWYNLDLESKNYMVPGLIAVLLTVVSMFLSSMGLVREKEIGTLEQLMVTPIKTWQLILGKVLPFFILGFFALALMLAVAFVVFQLTVAGNLVLLFSLSALYLLSTLGLGIFISTLAHTQQQAMFISWFFMIFMIFMSGFLFPIANMPEAWQRATYLNPLRYYVNLLREIFLKATPVEFLWIEIIPLAIFGLVILSASAMKFRKRVS